MRTVIFLGLLVIADALNKDWYTNTSTVNLMAVVLIVAIFMDLAEFIKKMTK